MSKLLKKSALALVLALAMLLMMVPAMAEDPPEESTTPVSSGSPIITKDTGNLYIYKLEHDYDDPTNNHTSIDGTQVSDGTMIDTTGWLAVPNVKFVAYKVVPLDLTNPELDEIAEYLDYTPAQRAAFVYKLTDVMKATEKFAYSDEDGIALFDDLPIGLYYVYEEDTYGVTESFNPFFVTVPITDPENLDNWLYDVYVYPKNTLEEAPVIDKYITQLDQKHDTAAAADQVLWIIYPEIPVGIANDNSDDGDAEDVRSYVITDQIDAKLFYNKDTLEVGYNGTLFEASASEIAKDGDYYTTYAGNLLTITLDPAGIAKLATIITRDYGYDGSLATGGDLPRLTITFTTTIIYDDDDSMGVDIDNDATLKYTNNFGKDFTTNSYDDDKENPKVHTGGLLIYKQNPDEDPLEDAVFAIFATLADAKAAAESGDYTKAIPAWDGYKTDKADNLDPDDRATEFKSDPDGYVKIFGLEYGEPVYSYVKEENGNYTRETIDNDYVYTEVDDGAGAYAYKLTGYTDNATTYYLVEKVAPQDYNLLKTPKAVVIGPGTHTVTGMTTVTNRQGFDLPITGGIGTVIFTVGGILLIALAAFLLLKKKGRAKA